MNAQNTRAAGRTLDVLERVLHDGAYANLALRDESDALVTRWVYTVLEKLLLLDFWIERLTEGKRVQRVTKQVLRMGLSAIVFLQLPDAVACDSCVSLMKRSGKGALSGFVNAVLRNAAKQKHSLSAPQGDDIAALSIRHNWPQWIIALWQRSYGKAFARDMLRFSPNADTVVRANTLVMDESSCIEALREKHGEVTRGQLLPQALRIASAGGLVNGELFRSGALAVQGEAAMLAAALVDARPGMRVLDACAAPGGKSAYLAAQMQNSGEVLALELHEHRVELIRAAAKRLGANIVTARQQDAAAFDPALGVFDAVLVDAPCSGLGVAHQKPDIRFRLWEEDIAQLSAVQRALLDTCCRYVRRGGALVYATCTISPEENEGVARAFTAAHADFAPDDFFGFLPENFDRARLARGMLQLFPHLDNTEGFFMARWIKR